MTFTDTPWPKDLHLPSLREKKRNANLIHEGRPPGAVSKITRDLKEGIIEAAVIVGSDGKGTGGLTGFLVDLAMHHKKAYASLLVKLLPMQVSGSGGAGGHIGTVNIVSVPSGSYLSHDEIEKLKMPSLLEHVPDPIADEPSE